MENADTAMVATFNFFEIFRQHLANFMLILKLTKKLKKELPKKVNI
jgi:hypothetical protein